MKGVVSVLILQPHMKTVHGIIECAPYRTITVHGTCVSFQSTFFGQNKLVKLPPAQAQVDTSDSTSMSAVL